MCRRGKPARTMTRRWIILSSLIAFFLLCLSGWVEFHRDKAWQIRRTRGSTCMISCFDGEIHLTWLGVPCFSADGWYFEYDGEHAPGTDEYPVQGLFKGGFQGPLNNFG